MTWANLLAPALWAAMQSPAVLTMDEALRIADQNAFGVRTAKSDLEKTRQRVAETKSRLGPRVNLDSTYTRFNEVIRSGDGSVVRPIDQAQSQLVVSMPLDITGILKKGVRASEAAIAVAQENLNSEKNDLKFNVRAAYFDVLQTEAQVKVFEETLATSQKRLRNTELEFEKGAKAKVDVIRFQTLVQQAEADLIAGRNAASLARNAFNNVLGRPIETPFALAEPPPMPRFEIDDTAMAGFAKQNRSELKAFRANQKVLELIRNAEEGGLSPSLNVSAVHSRDWKATSSGGRESSTFGQIVLSLPAFDSGVTRARVKAARQDEEQNRIRTEQAELGISLEVRQATTTLANAKARLESAQKQVEFATESFRLANVRYEAGEGILLEVTDAQTELTRARTALVTATYDYLRSFAQLQRAMGTDQPPTTRGGQTNEVRN
jgi:outer membrane protein